MTIDSLLLLLTLACLSMLAPCHSLIITAPAAQAETELAHRNAQFGAHSPDLNGALVFFDTFDINGTNANIAEMCETPVLSDDDRAAIMGKIFVVMRSYRASTYHCDFDTKVNISQSLGAIAVIVANRPLTEDSSQPSPMYGNTLVEMQSNNHSNVQITIDAVFIGYDSYHYLKALHDSLQYNDRGTQSVNVTIGEEFALYELAAVRYFSIFAPFVVVGFTVFNFIKAMREHYRELDEIRRNEENRARQAEARLRMTQNIARARQEPPQSQLVSVNDDNPIAFIPDPDVEDDVAVAVDSNHADNDDDTVSDSDSDDLDSEFDAELEDFFFHPPRSLTDIIDDYSVRLLALLSKPRSIAVANISMYGLQSVLSVLVLSMYWSEQCSNDLHYLPSWFFCRAIIGARIAFWQTHSSTPQPSCTEVFVKNWCDYVFLFTGSFEVWSAGTDCSASAPHILMAAQCAVTLIYVTFITRIALFLYIKCTALQASISQAESNSNGSSDASVSVSDHQSAANGGSGGSESTIEQSKLYCFARTILDILNGGFYCAGPLDTLRPATAMDLRFLPTIRYKPGLSFKRAESLDQDEMACSICMSEYEEGDVLRLLYCQRRAIHHYHKSCVDSWLLRNATCPLCRSSVSQERGEQQMEERKQRRERRRQRRERAPIVNNGGRASNSRGRPRSDIDYHEVDTEIEMAELV